MKSSKAAIAAVRVIRTEDPRFAQFWSLCPRRAGGNSRADAYKQWCACVASGVDPTELEAGARRYKAYCEAENMIGTRYVMQAKRFLGPGEHWKEPWVSDAKPLTLRDGWFADAS